MAFELPPLPWAEDALEPHISANTLGFHYGKHHNAYLTKLNAAVEGSADAEKSLDQIIRESAGDPGKAGLFNNAAQVWNHTFFWNSMKPGGGGEPTGELMDRIVNSFGSYGRFKETFVQMAVAQFGSGWAWLVADGRKLEIVTTSNAGNPTTDGKTPLMTCDVWEHAYYLDFQNRRPDFVTAFLDHLVNWDFAAQNLSK